ncbi:MAG: hypothetical protein KO206_00450 [Methanomicrobiaceae archaeon]|uniref:Uncharacterized protein n=1 Tax=hydrocarbon metagenome TaxID=938273 RepID=A0A0W8FI50_9ZZZZ|nr:hypothetical protein [Methanomicrobiaceae archaeon]MDD5420033.1 hypothetical protein [Methanomicrobiaceae archaeon]
MQRHAINPDGNGQARDLAVRNRIVIGEASGAGDPAITWHALGEEEVVQ